MKSVNSILNSIIAVLLIGGIYTLTAVTGETSPIEETGIAYETETETTVPPLTDVTVTTVPETSREIIFVTETTTAETSETDASTTEETTTTAETATTTVTTAATTTTTAVTTTTATTTADTELYEEDNPADTELYEEDDPADTELYEEDEVNEEDIPPETANEDDELDENEFTESGSFDDNGFPMGYDEPDAEIIDTATVTAVKNDIEWNLTNGEPADNSGADNGGSAGNTPAPPAAAASTLTAYFNGKRQTVDAFELVCAVTSNEVSDTFSDEAIKAQAVAAYTYISEANSRGEAPDVMVDYNYSLKLEKLVASVWGIACYHNGKLAQTVYSASSAGYTASSENVWGGAHPYLVSVATPFDAASDPNYGIKTTYTENEMRRILESNLSIYLSANPENWLIVTRLTDGSYVETVMVDGQVEISGRKLRESIMNYKIRSAAFSVSYYDGIFTITTYGYGHGVGMSQNGANILAKQGLNYVDILKYYYTGIEVK
jgi:stage II sporulation protein D